MPSYDEFMVIELPSQREPAFIIMIVNMAKFKKIKLYQFFSTVPVSSTFVMPSQALNRVSTFYFYQADRKKKKNSLVLFVFFEY